MSFSSFSKFSIFFFSFIMMGLALTSCSEDDLTNEDGSENFVFNEGNNGLGDRGPFGNRPPHGPGEGTKCFEFVFPISINYPDESIVTYEGIDSIKSDLREWFLANPDAIEIPDDLDINRPGHRINPMQIITSLDLESLPSLQYPIEVETEEDGVLTLNSNDDLLGLLEECGPRNGRRGKHPHRKPECFDLIFPVTVVLSDGTEITANSEDELHEQVRAYFEANPEVDRERPDLVFPVTVEYNDEEVTVEDEDAFEAILDSCRAEFGERGPRGNRGRGHRDHDDDERCFELVYPVTVALENGTTFTGDSRDDIREQVRAYFQANPEIDRERPDLVFPVTVVLEDGSTQEIDTEDDLDELKDSCDED